MQGMFILIVLFIGHQHVHGAYPPQQCYVCETGPCTNPGNADIKDCSDSGQGGTSSGESLVQNALGSKLVDIEKTFDAYVTTTLNLSDTVKPTWGNITRWVCYVTKDKHRGCLVAGKGFCDGPKGWLEKLTSLTDKIKSIMGKVKDAAKQMFSSSTTNAAVTPDLQANISNWFATNYMAGLMNNTKEDRYKLDSCCEANACNFGSNLRHSKFILLLLPFTFIIIA